MDEPTLGEISRRLTAVQDSIDKLSARVITADVWEAERKLIEQRMRQAEKDIGDIEAERKADSGSSENRRWLIYLALFTASLSFIAQLYFSTRGSV